MREKTFKIIEKGKEKVESCYVPEEEDANFVKKLQVCIGRFRGKPPFKCFSCGRVGHMLLRSLITKTRTRKNKLPK